MKSLGNGNYQLKIKCDRKVKVLRTNNSLEFCNQVFDSFCKEQGIERHRTAKNTSQQNGVAKRMDRTLLERVRRIQVTSRLPIGFQEEVLYTATYLVNKSPSSVIEFKCPEEMWTSRKPNLSHLRVCGCEASVHQLECKLELRALKCVFLGYQEGTKGYRLWKRGTSGVKVIVSKDVVFNKNCFPCKDANQTADTNQQASLDYNLASGAQFEVELEDNAEASQA